jgi:hypothetical protein
LTEHGADRRKGPSHRLDRELLSPTERRKAEDPASTFLYLDVQEGAYRIRDITLLRLQACDGDWPVVRRWPTPQSTG